MFGPISLEFSLNPFETRYFYSYNYCIYLDALRQMEEGKFPLQGSGRMIICSRGLVSRERWDRVPRFAEVLPNVSLSLSSPVVCRRPTFQGLPIWWCPWIHDVGLMAGCVRHGFMNINAMRSNTELPLNPSAILEHITRTFLNGRASEESPSHPDGGVVQSGDAALVSAADPGKVVNPPGSGVGGASSVGYGFLKTGKGFDPGDEAAQAWAEEASAEFPTRRSAEDRVFKICVAMTKLLPLNNPVRIRVYNERCD